MIRPFVSILVNWNLKDDTMDCIDSLIAAGQSPADIIVVDNGSSDGSVAALRARFGEALTIIANSENAGFAAAANQGIVEALARGSNWVFLLNNDTVVDRDIFSAFERARQGHPEFLILAPLILYHAFPDRIWFFGDRLRGSTLITRSLFKEGTRDQPLPEVAAVDFVSGCGMLVQREVFESIGNFDQGLFMYGEEVDFCWRARESGFRSAAVSGAVMWHKVSRSARRLKPEMRYFRIKNQITFYRRYAHGLNIPIMFLFTLARSLGIGGRDLLVRQPGLLVPLARAWFAGWFSPLPPPSYGKR